MKDKLEGDRNFYISHFPIFVNRTRSCRSNIEYQKKVETIVFEERLINLKTLNEVGNILGRSRERVRQIEWKLLKKFKKYKSDLEKCQTLIERSHL